MTTPTKEPLPPELQKAVDGLASDLEQMIPAEDRDEYRRFAKWIRPHLEKVFDGAYDDLPPNWRDEFKK